MENEQKTNTIREAVGYFETAKDLQAAIDGLLSSGFDRAEISLLATEHAIEEKLGHAYRRVEELEDDATVPRTYFVSNEAIGAAEGTLIGAPLYVAAVTAAGAILASGGSILAAYVGAAIAGGSSGFIGSVLAKLLDNRHAQRIEEQLDHGGLLLWVRTWDEGDEEKALDILNKHSGHDVHVHSIATT